MSEPSSTTPKPAGSGYLRKLVLLLLLQVASVLGLLLLFRSNPQAGLLGMNLLAVLLLGMVSGFGARFVLGKRNWFVRFVTATAVLIIGLYIFGLLTHWLVGVGPVVFWNKAIDWVGLAKLLMGITSQLLSMHVWRRRTTATVVVPVSAPVVSTSMPLVAEPSRPAPRANSRAKVRAKRKPSGQAHFPLFSPKSKPAAAKKAAKAQANSKKVTKPPTKPRPSLFHHKPQVHLSKIERHLCPYCLEPVTRNDARGVVECDICHTLHHGDCWAIAGSCQVPHYTAA